MLNILLITLDQFRGDCLAASGHAVVRTPNLDRLAHDGLNLRRHFSQSAPCGPGRASLYTGMYQMNHRVVANGAPLDDRHDNIARAARRAGYAPTLFGYTDQAIDPRVATGPDDPRLQSYEQVLPGFDVGLHTPSTDFGGWVAWLRAKGHAPAEAALAALAEESERPAEHSLTAFLTDGFLGWLETREGPWFAHLSHLRPHPPYAAAGHFSTLYDPADMPPPIAPADRRHRLHDGLLRNPLMAAPTEAAEARRLMAQYYGMISEVDFQLGRVWSALERSGQWDNTLIVVTADHGEQLCDHGLVQKAGYFEQSYHVLGLIRDPRADTVRGAGIEAFTENIDIFPTLCEAMGIEVPVQCDGAPLTPFLRGEAPPWWREAAHWEYDWRFGRIGDGPHPWPWDRRLERQTLSVRRDQTHAYVHFGDGSWLCFDLERDPTWRTLTDDPAVALTKAQALLTWRAVHADRTLTGMLTEGGGVGRWPPMPQGWRPADAQ